MQCIIYDKKSNGILLQFRIFGLKKLTGSEKLAMIKTEKDKNGLY